MRECEICFVDNIKDESIVFLKCAHSLCKSCYNKLVKDECPFCRCVFKRDEPKKKNNNHRISLEEYILQLDQEMHDKINRKNKMKENKKNRKNKRQEKKKNPSNNNKVKNRRKSLRHSYDENSSKKEINKNKYIFTKGYNKYVKK